MARGFASEVGGAARSQAAAAKSVARSASSEAGDPDVARLFQDTVEPKFHGQTGPRRLEMDVARAVFHRLLKQIVHQAHHVLRFFLRDVSAVLRKVCRPSVPI